MSEFIKKGSVILPRPEGLDYTLENERVYNLKYDNWNEFAFLETDGKLEFEGKVYSTEKDTKLFNRILTYFNNTDKNNVGVMFKGTKGSGKTLTAKRLAIASKLPIIIVNSDFPARKLNDFFTKFKQEVCVIFDEVEKNQRFWPTEQLIGFLDGIQHTSKKLVLLTCNEDKDVTEYMKDRCSRIRYYIEYKSVREDMVRQIIDDIIPDREDKNEIVEFVINIFSVCSYDNVISFAEEVRDCPDEDLTEIVDRLNINMK